MPKQNCQLNLQKHPSVVQTLKSRSVVKIDIKLLFDNVQKRFELQQEIL